MIDKFRDDVGHIRQGITDTSLGAQDGVRRLRQGWDDLFSQRTDVNRVPLIGDSPMVEQTYAALERGRPAIGDVDTRTVASIVAGARQQGLNGIDSIVGNNETLFAVQGRAPDDPAAKIASIDLAQAREQPVAVSAQLAPQTPAMGQTPALDDQPQRAAAMRS